MLGSERRMYIMQQIQRDGHADIHELEEQLGVSSMTIRRDLAKLQNEGLIRVEYGGAMLNSGTLFEYDISMKQQENLAQKRAIAKACADMVCEGETIFLDAGTTVCELAKNIAARKNLCVMTHSLLVANVLAGTGVELVMCPGRFRSKSMAFMGQMTSDFLAAFHFDKLFLGVDGVDFDQGVSVPDVDDGITKAAVVKQSNQVICMADSSKFDEIKHYSICALSGLSMIVTDAGIGESRLSHYSERVKIQVAQ